jgi:phospholipid/cholesterol/gamma-HCH transport system substrate-binding protein/paraquat-inducible protein B
MDDRTNYFKVGLFIISAALLTILTITVLGGGRVFQKTMTVETYFEESVQGLDVGSPVNFRGVKIGKIAEISLARREYATEAHYVLVRMALYPDAFPVKTGESAGEGLAAEVDKGLCCRLTILGLTGTARLEADYLPPEGHPPPLKIDWQPHYPYIPSVSSTITRLNEALDRIMKQLEKINMPAMAKTFENTLSLLAKTSEEFDLRGIRGEAGSLLSELRNTNGLLNEILRGKDVKTLLQDGAAMVSAGRAIVEDWKMPLKKFQTALLDTSESIDVLAEKLASVSEGLPETLVGLQKTLRRLDGFLMNQQQEIEVILSNIRVISENIKEVSENARQYPSQLLFGAPPPPPKRGSAR